MGETDDGKGSERYELGELFPGESPALLRCFKIAGGVIVVALLVLALAYPFFVS